MNLNADDVVRSAPSKKNRARWCRGKVGVEHQYKETERHDLPFMKDVFIKDNCAQCGRKRYRREAR